MFLKYQDYCFKLSTEESKTTIELFLGHLTGKDFLEGDELTKIQQNKIIEIIKNFLMTCDIEKEILQFGCHQNDIEFVRKETNLYATMESFEESGKIKDLETVLNYIEDGFIFFSNLNRLRKEKF